MKKALSVILCFLLMFTSMPIGSFNFTVIAGSYGSLSEEDFAIKVQQIKSQYPDGKYWNTYNGVDSEGIALAGNNICPGYNYASGKSCVAEGYCGANKSYCSCACGTYKGQQCHGFANLMAYKILGSYANSRVSDSGGVNSSKGWTYYTSVSEFYAGDFVRINDFSHTIFIYKVDGNTVSYVDCNASGPCQIDWDKTISVSSLKSKVSYVVHLSGNTLKGVADGPHTHNYNTYVYYWGSHPHYKCYQCSCGEVEANYSDPTFVPTCTTCNPPVTYDDIQPGNYFIRNKSNDTYLNIAYAADEDLATIHTYEFSNWDSQTFNIYRADEGYEMMPLCSSTRVVNPYCWTVESGKTVNLYSKTYESSQWWKFQPINGGYVIRNVQNPSVCISPSSSGLIVSEYAGKDYQIWCLEKACNINFDANGGSFEYKTQRTRAGYNTVLSTNKPTKSGGYRFMGWSTNKNDYYATYIAGQHITINDDLNLYAIWRKCTHEYSNPDETICSDCGIDKTKCKGDVDNSGATTLDDVVALAQVVAGWQNVAHNAAALDIDGNGSVTLDDVVLLAQYVAGWDVTLN